MFLIVIVGHLDSRLRGNDDLTLLFAGEVLELGHDFGCHEGHCFFVGLAGDWACGAIISGGRGRVQAGTRSSMTRRPA